MSVSDPGEKIEWGADSEPRKNERVPSSAFRYGSGEQNYNDHDESFAGLGQFKQMTSNY